MAWRGKEAVSARPRWYRPARSTPAETSTAAEKRQWEVHDQDLVEEIGKAVGLTYEDSEPLHTDEKVAKRDVNRWELNPASSEDYEERLHTQREEPAGGKRETPKGRSTKRQTGRRA